MSSFVHTPLPPCRPRRLPFITSTSIYIIKTECLALYDPLHVYSQYHIHILGCNMSWGSQSDIRGVCLCEHRSYRTSTLTKCRHSSSIWSAHHHLELTGLQPTCIDSVTLFAWQKLSSFVSCMTCLGVTYVRCYSTVERFRKTPPQAFLLT